MILRLTLCFNFFRRTFVRFFLHRRKTPEKSHAEDPESGQEEGPEKSIDQSEELVEQENPQ